MSEESLTKLELQTNQETMKHREKIREILKKIADLLHERGIQHDASKLLKPEVELLSKVNSELSGLTYPSEEYDKVMNSEDMQKFKEIHYSKNRHHPEHFNNDISKMNFFDLLEMIADWLASTERQNNGNILNSIDYNLNEKYKFSKDLKSIIKNTIELMEHIK